MNDQIKPRKPEDLSIIELQSELYVMKCRWADLGQKIEILENIRVQKIIAENTPKNEPTQEVAAGA